MPQQVVVIGAGPAGLSAAYELQKHGARSLILEAEKQIGGIAKTVEFEGFRFDLGGHRFFTKIPAIRELWDEILGDRFMVRPRISRIFYRNKLFHYPLRPISAMRQLGPATALAVAASYLWARLFPQRPENDFQTWVSNRFGRRLYEMFFETYTEKVWGAPCTEISADWAAQRIRDLSLWRVLTEPFRRRGNRQSHSLIQQFNYPPRGPQEMWDEFARRLTAGGQTIITGQRVTTLEVRDHQVRRVVAETTSGDRQTHEAEGVISTMPLSALVMALDPPPPANVLAAAHDLRYRAYLTVCLIVEAEAPFDDNWIYIHTPDVRMGRLQNFTNWSPQMVPKPGTTSLGLEYFAWQNDDLWTSSDNEIIALGLKELDRLKLMPTDAVRRGYVIRSPNAYPVYDPGYRERIAVVRDYLSTIGNLQTCGRAGLHRYNNMDHSMLTGALAARNLFGEANDVWAVNVDTEYVEEGSA